MCSCQRTLPTYTPRGVTPAVVVSAKIRYQVVGVAGVEPATLRLSSACSNQLSYTPGMVGGAEESRTPDL